jgi:cytochrome c oxidase cbb3-type subunit 2
MSQNNNTATGFSHEKVETSNFLMIVLIVLVVAVGGLAEIVPLFFQKSTTEPVQGLKPYTALQLAGRDVYLREGCYNCHSQMIRPFRAETLRYGHYSVRGSSFMTTRSSGARSVPVLICTVLAASTVMNGIVST